MSQLEITFEISEFIADRIAAFPRNRFALPECGALPLYADLDGVVGIRPDGAIVEWSLDGRGRDVRPVEDRIRILIALAAAARPYPELQKLLPVHGPGSMPCECRRIPAFVSGLVDCDRCGRMGWLSEGDGRPIVRTRRPRRKLSAIGLVLVALAIASFYGAYAILAGPPRGYFFNGVILTALGTLSLVLAFRGFGSRPRSQRRRPAQGPNFDADDPEVAALPPTSMTRFSERIRLARESRKEAQD